MKIWVNEILVDLFSRDECQSLCEKSYVEIE